MLLLLHDGEVDVRLVSLQRHKLGTHTFDYSRIRFRSGKVVGDLVGQGACFA